MNITTSPKIWAYRNFLTVVHQATEIIERKAGPKSETLAVYWGLVATGSTADFALQVTVVDSASPQSPFTFADVTDLQALRQSFGGGAAVRLARDTPWRTVLKKAEATLHAPDRAHEAEGVIPYSQPEAVVR